jgi:glycosyltransferase involved in cell wall biosynthesis
MRRAAVLALSSKFEGLPTVVIEALACGARVVSTDCPTGPAEILENGRWGALVPVGDAEAFAAALVAAIRAGRWPTPPAEALRPYTEAPVVEAFERVLRPLLENRRVVH